MSDTIVKSLREKSYYIHRNFLNNRELKMLKNFLLEESQKMSDSLYQRKTIYKLQRYHLDPNLKILKKFYTGKSLILDVAEKFNNNKIQVKKCTLEIKNPLKEKTNEKGAHLLHSDGPFNILKSCLYLEDVNKKDGPFTILPGSHKLFYGNMKFFKKKMKYLSSNIYDHTFSENEEHDLSINKKCVECVGKAGDLIFVNISAWHKGGKILDHGKRMVLWNYLYDKKKFNTLVRKIVPNN